MNSHQLQCGAPHFRTLAKRLRNANYNYSKVIGEFLDYPVQKASKIHIRTEIDDTGRLQEISVSDNIYDGFVGITEIGAANPFNMGHEKLGHDDDNETSEFGVGMKAAALSCGNLLKVYTKIREDVNRYAYYEAECDFLKMEKKEDVNDSYNPQIRNIASNDYNSIHLFENGSTLTVSKIRNEIFPLTTIQEITEKTKEIVSNMYSYYIKQGVEIYINEELVSLQHNFFDEKNCIPFTITKKLYILTNRSSGDLVVIASKKLEKLIWQIYDSSTRKYNRLDHKFNDYVSDLLSKGYEWMYCPVNNYDKASILINTTYTYFSKLFHSAENNDMKLPFNKCDIIKDGRKYGNVSFDKKNNGAKNYIAHHVEFKSKKIGKKLGMTFNKEINLELQNDLVYALKAAVNDSADKYGNSSKADIKFDEACRKAILLNIIDWKTCSPDMLSSQLLWEKNNDETKSKEKEVNKAVSTALKISSASSVFIEESDTKLQEDELEVEVEVEVEDDKHEVQKQEKNMVQHQNDINKKEDDTLSNISEELQDDVNDNSTEGQNMETDDCENSIKIEDDTTDNKLEIEYIVSISDDINKIEFEKMKELIITELNAITYSSTNMQILRDISVQILCKNKTGEMY
jgi:hypothetical protein